MAKKDASMKKDETITSSIPENLVPVENQVKVVPEEKELIPPEIRVIVDGQEQEVIDKKIPNALTLPVLEKGTVPLYRLILIASRIEGYDDIYNQVYAMLINYYDEKVEEKEQEEQEEAEAEEE